MKLADDEFVNLEAMNTGTADRKPADGQRTDGHSADREGTEKQ